MLPDTMPNEGKMYRNIASGKAVFSRGQKLCLVVIVLFVTITTLSGLAQTITSVLAQRDLEGIAIGFGLRFLLLSIFWIFLGVKGLLPDGGALKKYRLSANP